MQYTYNIHTMNLRIKSSNLASLTKFTNSVCIESASTATGEIRFPGKAGFPSYDIQKFLINK